LVRFSPKPPALRLIKNTGAAPSLNRRMTDGRFRVVPSR
jgi:hypothetical protein